MGHDIFMAFVPLFFAMDPVGVLPIFAGLTQELNAQEKKKVIAQSMITATVLAFSFILVGRAVFQLLSIQMGDFMVAGGAILFIIAMKDLTTSVDHRRGLQEMGAVPIGTPLVVGPAVLTMVLMQVDQHGIGPTMAAVLINLFLVAVVFIASDQLMKILGQSGARALSKVMSLLLAAIGIMMIRRGIIDIILRWHG